MTHFNEFDEKLNLTVGRLKWYEKEHFYPKRKNIYITELATFFCILIVLPNFTEFHIWAFILLITYFGA